MAGQMQELLRNKKALAGVGVAGLVGAFVLVQKKKAGASSSSTTGSVDAGTVASGAPVGYADTSGSDVANTLGSFNQQQQQVLANFSQQLTDSLAGFTTGLQNTPTSPATNVPTPAAPSTPTPAAAPAAPKPATPATGSINRPTIGGTIAKYFTITKKGQNWNTVEAATHESASQLRALNPKGLVALKVGDKVRIG